MCNKVRFVNLLVGWSQWHSAGGGGGGGGGVLEHQANTPAPIPPHPTPSSQHNVMKANKQTTSTYDTRVKHLHIRKRGRSELSNILKTLEAWYTEMQCSYINPVFINKPRGL